MDEPRPLIASEAVGAEEIEPRAAVRRRGAEEVDPGRDEAEEAIRIAGDEELHRDPPGLVHAPLHAERREIALARHVGDPRARVKAIEDVEALDGDEGQPRVGGLGILCAEEVGAEHDDVEGDQNDRAREREAVLPEAPPDQAPARGDGDALLGCHGDRRREHAHLIPSSNLIRGSSQARRMSEIKVPTIVRKQ